MAFREQGILTLTGNERIIRIPESAFSNPLSPTDIEVKIWANSYINPNELRESIIVYQSLDGSDSNYKYVWYLIRDTSAPVDISRIKDSNTIPGYILVNHVVLTSEPLPTGNISNTNSISESPEGQHWIIDVNGVAVNMNKSSGDYEVTNSNKGFVMTADNGSRIRVKVLSDNSIITENI